jgi:DNA-binding NtrC family response regulator
MSVPRQPCGHVQAPRRVVLLVEDEPFVRDATCQVLEKAGYEVLSTGDAIEAVRAYHRRDGHIDLLMTDMTLPGRSGTQLSLDLRSTSAAMPILLTSGYPENDSDRQSREPKTYFLPKPYSRTDLVAVVDKILGPKILGTKILGPSVHPRTDSRAG